MSRRIEWDEIGFDTEKTKWLYGPGEIVDEHGCENGQYALSFYGSCIEGSPEDYIWDRYIGPMLDDLSQHLGEADPMLTSRSNPLLAAFREYTADSDSMSLRWSAGCWLAVMERDARGIGTNYRKQYEAVTATQRERAHAYLVLTRIERFGVL